MKGHDDFVCSVCVIEPTAKNPKGYIVTGSNDNNVCIYHPGDEQPIRTLKAHDNTVCGLRASVIEDESFLSCSADSTAKLWDLYDLAKPESTFSGHPNSVVWCVADLPNGSVITGGSDNTVVVYLRTGSVAHKLAGHTDCVRDIAGINDNEFLTCGNDAVTKHWNATSGACFGTYQAHASHVYSVSIINNGNLAVSCGEDRTLRVWRNGQVDQSIALPARTVWSVKILPNEDLVCGSSDGVVRIFTTDSARFAEQGAMRKYEEAALENIKSYSNQNKHSDID